MAKIGTSAKYAGWPVVGRLTTRDSMRHYRHLARFMIMAGAIGADILSVVLSAILGAQLRQGSLSSDNWLQFIGLVLPTYVLATAFLRGYSLKTLQESWPAVSRALLALAISVSVGFCAVFALQAGTRFSRLETAYTVLAAAGLLTLVRLIGVVLVKPVFRELIDESAIVISDGSFPILEGASARSIRVVDVRQAGMDSPRNDPVFLDQVGQLVRDVDRVILFFGESDARQRWVEAMRLCGVDAEIVAELGEMRPLGLSRWQQQSTLVISRGPLTLTERSAKRLFDIVVTLAAAPLWVPIVAAAALAVKIDSPGPAFFVQERVGQNNRRYRCYKLRTMRHDMQDPAGLVSACPADARMTRVGRFLRKLSLDELPQLGNVLLGEMSLVGPRPHALGSTAEGALFWDVLPGYWTRHAMKPGVTGLAQVRGLRGSTLTRADIERRLASDLEYINGWSPWLDVRILFRTIAVVSHKNAY